MSFKVISGASQAKLMPLDGGCEIDDVGCIEAGPLSPGFFVAKKGDKPFTYAYKYNEYKYIVEGEFEFEVEGKVHSAKAGDVVEFPAGITVIFSSPSYGKAFYCGIRKYRDL